MNPLDIRRRNKNTQTVQRISYPNEKKTANRTSNTIYVVIDIPALMFLVIILLNHMIVKLQFS